jgi:hypothetical protein
MSKPTLTKKQSYWFNHIQQCEQQNLTAPVYCDQHDLKISQLYSYKYELRRKGIIQPDLALPVAAFTKAHIKPPQKSMPSKVNPMTFSFSLVLGVFRLQMTMGSPLL